MRCAKTGVRNTEVNKPRPETNVNKAATLRERLRNTLKLTTGAGVWSSHKTNATRQTTATIVNTRMYLLENQSSVCPLSNTVCSEPTPPTSKAMPVQSTVLTVVLIGDSLSRK